MSSRVRSDSHRRIPITSTKNYSSYLHGTHKSPNLWRRVFGLGETVQQRRDRLSGRGAKKTPLPWWTRKASKSNNPQVIKSPNNGVFSVENPLAVRSRASSTVSNPAVQRSRSSSTVSNPAVEPTRHGIPFSQLTEEEKKILKNSLAGFQEEINRRYSKNSKEKTRNQKVKNRLEAATRSKAHRDAAAANMTKTSRSKAGKNAEESKMRQGLFLKELSKRGATSKLPEFLGPAEERTSKARARNMKEKPATAT